MEFVIVMGGIFLVVVLVGTIIVLVALLRMAHEKAQAAEVRAQDAEMHALERANKLLVQKEKEMRADAITRSKRTLRGKVYEHLVPFEDDFGFNPQDCRFLGAPVDYLVYDGLSEGALERIVFLEIKTGHSRLTTRQRLVKKTIEEGEVEFQVYRG